MNKKSNKKIIIYIICLIIFVSIVIGALALGRKFKENPKNEIDSKIEKSQSDKNYKIVSKYNANIKKNQDVKLRIENIIRGEEAEKALNNYNKKASYQVNIEKKDEEELLLVEYEIDFIDFDMSDIGANKDVSAKICQDENKEYIEYNNNKPVKIQNIRSSVYVIISDVLKLFLNILNMSNNRPIKIPFIVNIKNRFA